MLCRLREMSEPASRRPLKSRSVPVFRILAARLAATGVTADAISAVGLVFGIAGGVVLAMTSHVDARAAQVACWLAAAVCVQFRLLCNMLDGMVAVEGGRRSRLGPLWNEVPDRVSDSATLIGAGYALGSVPELGWAAALLAMMTAYIRAIGAQNGAGEAFLGWLSKPRRMFFVTLACLAGAAGFPAMEPALWLIVLGSALTCVQRLVWIGGRIGR